MANRIHDAFDNIKAEPQLVESTKQFLSEKRMSKSKFVCRPMFQMKTIVVCMVLMIVVGIGSYSWLQIPVSYVSIDVNPSIELALNRLNRVVSSKAYNADGEKILKGLSLKGMKYTDAINEIVESKKMEAYLTDDAELVFTVASDPEKESELQSGVANCSSHINHSCQSVSTDIELVSHAHDNNISVGKYYAWLQLSQYDDTVTVDECRDMSMSEIHGLISEHEQDGDHEQDASHSQNSDYKHNANHSQDGDYEHDDSDEAHNGNSSTQSGKHHRDNHND